MIKLATRLEESFELQRRCGTEREIYRAWFCLSNCVQMRFPCFEERRGVHCFRPDERFFGLRFCPRIAEADRRSPIPLPTQSFRLNVSKTSDAEQQFALVSMELSDSLCG